MRARSPMVLVLLAQAAFFATVLPRTTHAQAGEILARIGARTITEAELEERMARLSPEMQQYYATPEGRQELLRQLVRIEVFSRRARELGMDQDPSYKARIEAVASTFLASDYMRRVAQSVEVSDEDARAYYRAHLDTYRVPEMIKAPQIVIKLPSGASPEEIARRETRIDEARRRALAGEPWATLVKDYNENVFAGNEDFFPRGRLSPSLVDAVFGLEVGEVSPVLRVPDALLLFKLEARQPARVRPFEEVREEVHDALVEQERDESLIREEMALFARYGVDLEPTGTPEVPGTVLEGRIAQVRAETREGSRLRGWLTVDTDPPAPGPTIVFTVTADTKVVRDTGDGGEKPVALNGLTPGQRVRIAFSGPMAPSAPPRADADVITLLAGPAPTH